MTHDEIVKVLGFLEMPKEKQEAWMRAARRYLDLQREINEVLATCSGCRQGHLPLSLERHKTVDTWYKHDTGDRIVEPPLCP